MIIRETNEHLSVIVQIILNHPHSSYHHQVNFQAMHQTIMQQNVGNDSSNQSARERSRSPPRGGQAYVLKQPIGQYATDFKQYGFLQRVDEKASRMSPSSLG